MFLVALVIAVPQMGDIRAAESEPVEVHVGSELEFRPYSFVDSNGQAAGFSADLIRAVANKMGLRIRITTGPWDDMWSGLVAGKFDVLPTVAKTSGREPLVDFSLPHTETFDAFFVRKGRPELPNLAAAAGKEIVVLRSDAAHHQLEERHFDGKVIPVESIPEGMRLVAAGKHDAFLCSKLIGVLECKEAGVEGLEPGPPIPDYKRVFSFAVHKGNTELLEKLNQGLLLVKTSGEYDQIYRRWLTVEEPWRRWVPYLQWAVAAIVVLALLVVTLQFLVRRRTRQLSRAHAALSVEVAERRKAQESLQQLNETLELRVTERTAALRQSEERLLASEERYRSLFDSMTEGFALHEIVTDAGGRPVDYRFLDVNSAFERLTGLKRADLVGRRVLEVMPDTESHWIEGYGRVALTGEPLHMENRSGALDRWYDVFAYRTAPGQFAVVFSDITDRKRAERVLADSERRLRLACRAAKLGLFEWDIDKDEGYWNREHYELLGMEPGSPLSFEVWLARVHPDDRDRILRSTEKLVADARNGKQNGLHADEYRIVRPDGAATWLESTLSVECDGHVVMRGMVRDITDRKRAQEALRESELFYRQTLESIPGMVFTTSPDGYCDYQSQQWVDYTGVPMSEHVGDGWNKLLHPDDRPRAFAAWQAAVEGRSPYDLEYRVRRHDGQYEWFKVIGRPICDANGQVVRWFGVAANIDALKAAEDDVRQAANELARSNKELEQFAYISSHDLQEPLRQVVCFGNLLTQRYADQLDERGKQYIAFMAEGSQRMSNLVRSLLDYSRVGRPGGKVEPVSADEALDAALLNLKATIEESQARLTRDSLPTVLTHPVELGQLFQNLIGNALKFRRDGVTPEVHVGCKPDGSAGTFWVKDNGIGIPPDLHERTFQVFQRLHGQGKYPGTGIGLAICKKIVERHGGRIWIESVVGEGATFFFTLPLAKEAQA